ncbi:hypothetical protein LNQ81_13345 [Myroides sp. M-43]|uniref:hypothetical protein n=1 Tax=Myroides oncorhynchi TaxID=2893756 RepID=UPI001E4A0578|nr:hypothetical protein [Myroides oncorhynchi]MCC9043657.1 hypothetical protein [Myroides oncorhynchi]
MSKINILLVLVFLAVSCSSDQNNYPSEIEYGISNSTKIRPPKWLQGTWRINTNSSPSGLTPGFIVMPDQLCFVSISVECFQDMIDYSYKVNPEAVKIEQEYNLDYYRLTINIATEITTFSFTLKDNFKALYTNGSVKGTLFKEH